jgi:ABC-2 type transport system ATP-binding protein
LYRPLTRAHRGDPEGGRPAPVLDRGSRQPDIRRAGGTIAAPWPAREDSLPSPAAIEVEELVKVFGRRGREPVRAVDRLSFAVPGGSVFGLLGPNGAGKTTTIKILTTLIRPTSGAARVMGFDVSSRPLDVRRRISVVIQESAADLFLTVRDNLLTFARFHGLGRREARERAERVLEQFGLTAEAGRKTLDLSGGYRRRVQVAKMFMVDTPVMFLDEFSTGMDALLKRSIIAALRAEADRGRTIVLTTHVLSEAEELCDDILIVNRGREVARGDLHALRLLSEGFYEVALTYEELPPGLEAELAERGPLRLRIKNDTVEIALREPGDRVLALVAELATRGRVLRVEVRGASLEDVFVELTEKS